MSKKQTKLEVQKKPMGQPPYKPTDDERKLVEAAAGWGVTHEQIALSLNTGKGITVETMQKYYGVELKRGKALAHMKVGQTLFQKAISGDMTAVIWYTKTQMRFREVREVEISAGNSLAAAVGLLQSELEPDSSGMVINVDTAKQH